MKLKSPVGIMFHNFHDQNFFKKSLGSISSSKFKKLLINLKKKNIVDPRTFVSNFNLKKPKSNLYCLTFDDGLKSQIKIALPILKKEKIKAFFLYLPQSLPLNQILWSYIDILEIIILLILMIFIKIFYYL